MRRQYGDAFLLTMLSTYEHISAYGARAPSEAGGRVTSSGSLGGMPQAVDESGRQLNMSLAIKVSGVAN